MKKSNRKKKKQKAFLEKVDQMQSRIDRWEQLIKDIDNLGYVDKKYITQLTKFLNLARELMQKTLWAKNNEVRLKAFANMKTTFRNLQTTLNQIESAYPDILNEPFMPSYKN